MPISSRYLITTTSAFLIVGLLALLSIVGMNFWLSQRAQFYFDDAIAARDTRAAAVDLRSAMQIAESSQRGFIITGNEIYLAPYQSAKTQVQNRLTALQPLLLSYPSSNLALPHLAAILTAKFEEFDRTIELKRNQRTDDINVIFRTNSGKSLTDEANVFFTGIIGNADQRLTARVDEQRRNADWLRILTALGAVVIITVISFAVLGIGRYTRELRKMHEAVDALNSNLEKKVEDRTADLARARDQAEVLLSEVNHRVANSLALVSSLVNLQSNSLQDPTAKSALAETQERIFAISLVHKRLYESNDIRSVSLNEYLTGLLDHLRTSLRSKGDGIKLSFDIASVALETDRSINLGVVVTELVTNSYKYAYPDGVGEVRVKLRELPDDRAELLVEDDGIGRAEGAPAKGTGVGSKIVNAMSISLGARINYPRLKLGTTAHLEFSTKPRRTIAAQ